MQRPIDRFRLVAYASLALLSACAHVPEAAPAPPPAPPAFAGDARLREQTDAATAPALAAWWLGFHDDILTGLIQRALAENLDLAVALRRVDQARAAAAGYGARRLPQVAFDSRVLRQRQSLLSPEGELASAFPGYERNQTLEGIGIGSTWEADLAGGLRNSESAAIAEWQAAEASRLGVRVTIVAEVADAYFQVRAAQDRTTVANGHLRTRERFLDLTRDRMRGGLATQGDGAQAEASVLQARLVIPDLQAEKLRQLNRLDVLLGEPPGSFAGAALDTVPTPHAPYVIPGLPADLAPTELMRRRPDVIAAERQLDAAQSRIGVASAEYYPRLTLGGVLGSESLHGAVFSSAAFQPQALVGLHWRLFDFGRVDAEVAQARGARAEALAQVRVRMLRATEDVENALVRLSQLDAQKSDLGHLVDARRAALAAAQTAYRGGASSLFEVIEQERALFGALDQDAQLQANRARAAVSAFRAFGGGWAPEPAM